MPTVEKERHGMALPPAAEAIAVILREHLPELKERYRIVSLGIFGSYVWGEETEESDVDLLIELDNPHLGLLGFMGLQNALSDLIGKEVDLVEKDALVEGVIGRNILAEVVEL